MDNSYILKLGSTFNGDYANPLFRVMDITFK